MKISERETNQWAKQKMREWYELEFRQDHEGIRYQRGWTEENPKRIVLTNTSPRHMKVLKEMEERIKKERENMYKAGDLVQHYKGPLYAILSIAPDTETKIMCVNYIEINKKEAWKRDLEMFSSNEMYNGKEVKRFTVVGSAIVTIIAGTYKIVHYKIIPNELTLSSYIKPHALPNILITNTTTNEQAYLMAVDPDGESVILGPVDGRIDPEYMERTWVVSSSEVVSDYTVCYVPTFDKSEEVNIDNPIPIKGILTTNPEIEKLASELRERHINARSEK